MFNLIFNAMKRVLVAMLGLASIVACSKTEVVSVSEGNTIKFDNAFVGNPTKAGLPTDDQITADKIGHFYVYANTDASTKVFEGVKVYKSNGQWVYDELKKWESGKTYRFAAFAVKDAELPSEICTPSFDYDTHTLKIENYISDNTNQRDLLMATSDQNLTDANEAVQFTFKHALSMVKFTFKSSLGDKNPIEISDFKVTGVNTKGTATCVGNNIAWTSSEPSTVGTEFTDETWTNVTTTDAQSSDEFVFIPQGGESSAVTVTVKFKATIKNESYVPVIEKDLTATINLNTAENAWKPGLRYNYVATITGTDMDVIEFAAPEVDPWPGYTDSDVVLTK